MYELFLTASVEGEDLGAACAILGGLCEMAPWEALTRVLYFRGPPRPVGITNQASLDKPMRKDAALFWKDLHQSLSRQSCIIQARYEVVKERDMGPAATPMDLDATPGVLRWADFPDPPHGRPLITQRKLVEIWEQKKLPSVLQDNQFRFTSEMLEENYHFFRDEIEFRLTRQYFTRGIDDYTTLESRREPEITPLSTLPGWNSITPVDSQNRWILLVKRHVTQDNKPDEIKKAQDELLSVCDELEGAFAFKVIDRKVHDTRITQQQPGIQALPQRVMLGKT